MLKKLDERKNIYDIIKLVTIPKAKGSGIN